MKFRTTVKIVLVFSVVLLCTGFALYSFFRLSAASQQKDFNLYTLVPSTSSAVFMTEDVNTLVAEIESLSCGRGNDFHISKIFSAIKRSFQSFKDDTPHGLSRQMNQILLSFHEPADEYNQVLYCRLGIGDQDLVDRFVQTHFGSTYSPKVFSYQGEKIYIYPTSEGDFVACYRSVDFLVLSYQKRLIEEVIDALRTGKSLANDTSFRSVNRLHKSASTATLYARITGMSGWTEFDMKLKGDFIYLSGSGQEEADTCVVGDVFRHRTLLTGFTGNMLPATTCYFSRQGIGEWTSLEDDSLAAQSDTLGYDRELSRYLMENAGQELTVCSFYLDDSLTHPVTVMRLPVAERVEAEHTLYTMANKLPLKVGERKSTRISWLYSPDRAYPVYCFPSTALFARLSSLPASLPLLYATFYQDSLLLSADRKGLSGYMRCLERGEVLEHSSVYRSGVDRLNTSYVCMLMADLNSLSVLPHYRPSVIPLFVFSYAEFFRHFVLFAQFTYVDGKLHPHIVLKYEGEESGM